MFTSVPYLPGKAPIPMWPPIRITGPVWPPIRKTKPMPSEM